MQIGSFKRDPLEDLKEHQTGTEKKVRNSVLGSSSDSVSDWLGTLEESRHSIFPSGKWEELYSLGADSEAADSRRWMAALPDGGETGTVSLCHPHPFLLEFLRRQRRGKASFPGNLL